jgi:TIR domain
MEGCKNGRGKAKMTIEEFIEKCEKRPLPSNPIARVRSLARELAEGVSYGLWDYKMPVEFNHDTGKVSFLDEQQNFALMLYFLQRWNQHPPNLQLAKHLGYLEGGHYTTHGKQTDFIIQPKSFDLLEEADPKTIFISYKRSESSAFALLIEQSLIQSGMSPFLDKQLQAGDDWHAELEKRIEQSDYLIIILGQETLKSVVTVREITWAIKYNTGIIPIWHNSFSFDSDDWEHLNPKISEVINNKHAIRVLEENPLLYDTALRELLNRFGITA